MRIFNLFELEKEIQVMDIGAAAIAEVPVYKILCEKMMAHLTVFDGDVRQIEKIESIYGRDNVSVFNCFVFDGKKQQVYLCSPQSGMTSIFKPNIKSLNFFNGFNRFGRVERTDEVHTTKLDDIKGVKPPDFLKMDVQGAELGILENGSRTLKDCLAIQLEVSFFPLYEKQPSFGAVDIHMRSKGFVPHCFKSVKRWSIAPTIFKNNFRIPGNQLLESDIIYVKDPLKIDELNDIQLKKLTVLAHYSFESYDYCIFLILEMERRGLLNAGSHKVYTKTFNEIQ